MYKVKTTTEQGTTGTLSIEMLRPPQGDQMFLGVYPAKVAIRVQPISALNS